MVHFRRLAWMMMTLGLAVPSARARAETQYQKPAQSVLDVLHAQLPPNASVSPTHDSMILATPVRYPPISDLAQPFFRLAGGARYPQQPRSLGPTVWTEPRANS